VRVVRCLFAAFMVLAGLNCVRMNVESLAYLLRRHTATPEDLRLIALGIVAGLAFAALGLLLFWRTASPKSPLPPGP
jgi:hypothetical protein